VEWITKFWKRSISDRSHSRISIFQEETVAKGQKRSNREKKKPKASKKKAAPTASPFASTAPRVKPSQSDVLKKTP
jgi:hypothetical protein